MEEEMREIETEIQQLEGSEMQGKYLTFWTDHQLFGVPISVVVQIVGMQKITSIPEFPDYAKGIINLRGAIIPLIDVRLRCGKEDIAYTERTCIIVAMIQGAQVGFIVDEVCEVTAISDENISNPPQMSEDCTNEYLTGIARHGDKIVLLMDTSKLINSKELVQFIPK